MPNGSDSIDVQRLIAEVAARHNLFLKPDDPAIALVTMNNLVLRAAIDIVHAEVRVTITEFHASMQKAEKRAGSMLAQTVKESTVRMQQGFAERYSRCRPEGARDCTSGERGASAPGAHPLVGPWAGGRCFAVRRWHLAWDAAPLEVRYVDSDLPLDLLGRKNVLRFLAGWALVMLFFLYCFVHEAFDQA